MRARDFFKCAFAFKTKMYKINIKLILLCVFSTTLKLFEKQYMSLVFFQPCLQLYDNSYITKTTLKKYKYSFSSFTFLHHFFLLLLDSVRNRKSNASFHSKQREHQEISLTNRSTSPRLCSSV